MDSNLELEDFLKEIKKVNQSRVHKVNNSLGVYDAYKWIRKNKWLNIGRALTEHEFYSIIRKMNLALANKLLEGKEIQLPCRMGQLELRKYQGSFKIKDGKVKTNLPIDWNETLKLWYEDEDSHQKKTLVKMDQKEIYRIYYNKWSARYQNVSFYEFKANRDLKKQIEQRIKEGKLDAFKFKENELE